MNPECLKHCPNINRCRTNVRVMSGSFGFMPGLDFAVRGNASKILAEAETLSAECPGPIPTRVEVLDGIFHPKKIKVTYYNCPQLRTEL